MTDAPQRLKATDAKSHTRVLYKGEPWYLYKDVNGWYVHDLDGRHYLTTDADGYIEGVTTCKTTD